MASWAEKPCGKVAADDGLKAANTIPAMDDRGLPRPLAVRLREDRLPRLRRGASDLALARLAAKFGPEISLRDLKGRFHTTVSGGLSRGLRRASRPAAANSLTSSIRAHRMRRQAW